MPRSSPSDEPEPTERWSGVRRSASHGKQSVLLHHVRSGDIAVKGGNMAEILLQLLGSLAQLTILDREVTAW